MIWGYLLLFFTGILNAIFSFLPDVTTLPSIGGFDVDANLVTGASYFYTFIHAFWPLETLFAAVMMWYTFLGIMLLSKLLLGSRAPH